MSRWAFILQVLLLCTAVEASLFGVLRGKRAGPAVVSFETIREVNPNATPWRQKQSGNALLDVGLDNGLAAAVV